MEIQPISILKDERKRETIAEFHRKHPLKCVFAHTFELIKDFHTTLNLLLVWAICILLCLYANGYHIVDTAAAADNT